MTTGLGARVRWNRPVAATDTLVVEPELRLRWEHDVGDVTARTRSALAGATFTVDSARFGRDAAVLETGLALKIGRNVSLYGEYRGELRMHETGHTLGGGLRIVW